jgi:asparagine synthase (glutamine-hydrolysing)
MARSASLAPIDAFVMNCMYLDDAQKAAIYKPDFARQLSRSNVAIQHHCAFDRMQHADFLNQMLYADTKIFMTSLNLTYNDKMSMASSVEVRVPFLDRELAEFAATQVPVQYKLKGFIRPTTKYLLRKAMAPVLPPEVLRQPKAGFAAPVDYWLANEMREIVDDVLSPSQIKKRNLFRYEGLCAMIDQHRKGGQDWSPQIWQFLTLELWMQTFLDKPASSFIDSVPMQVATA